MNGLQLNKAELFFIYEAWEGDFKEDIIRHYWKLNNYHSIMGEGTKIFPNFESIVDLTEEWMFKVGSQEYFGDPLEYMALSTEQVVKFYEECRFDNESDFKRDLYTVLSSTNLIFVLNDGTVKNPPVRAVW